MVAIDSTRIINPTSSGPSPTLVGVAVPAFDRMTISRQSSGPTVQIDAKPAAVIMPIAKKKLSSDKLNGQSLSLRTVPASQVTQLANQFSNGQLSNNYLSDDHLSDDEVVSVPQATSNSINSFLQTPNITEAALEAALFQRQQMILRQQASTSTTYRPPSRLANVGKVMNAPKEYYPVGYDKNFDDNFASRVELPDTSFRCGDQKHFPGLYADEDLGCMVSLYNIYVNSIFKWLHAYIKSTK